MFTDFIFHCKIRLVFCVLDIFYTLRRVNIWHVLWAAAEAVAVAEAEVPAAEVPAVGAVQAEAVQWDQADAVQAVLLVPVIPAEAQRGAQEEATAVKHPAAIR